MNAAFRYLDGCEYIRQELCGLVILQLELQVTDVNPGSLLKGWEEMCTKQKFELLSHESGKMWSLMKVVLTKEDVNKNKAGDWTNLVSI